MNGTAFGPFFVVGGEVATGMFVQPGDTLQLLSSGFVNFGGGVIGMGNPILPADGDTWETPSDYPAPMLRKNSLIFRIRLSGSENPGTFRWFQGGTNATLTIPAGVDSGEVILRANDGHPEDNIGTQTSPRGWEVRLGLSPGPSSARISSMEIVQCLQSVNNSIPLVARKATAVRVYVLGGPNGLAGVTGTIRAVDASTGTVLADGVAPVNVPFNAPATLNRNLPNSSLNFLLPIAVTTVPSVTITVQVMPLNQQLSVTVSFVPRAPQPVLPVLVRDTVNGLGPPSFADFLNVLRTGVLPRFPVADDATGFLLAQPIVFSSVGPWGLHTWAGWGNLLANLIATKLATGFRGILAAVTPPGDSPDISQGVAPPFGHAVLLADIAHPLTLAHEMGHVFGLGHSPCNGPNSPECDFWNGSCDPRLPRNGRTDEVGFDVARMDVVPGGVSELMSYCDHTKWPSVATYTTIFNRGVVL